MLDLMREFHGDARIGLERTASDLEGIGAVTNTLAPIPYTYGFSMVINQ